MVTAAIGIAPVVPFIGRFGPWPLLIPAALLAVGVASLIVGATITVLSNEGVQAGATVAGLSEIPKDGCGRENAGARWPARSRALPYAVALGLASAWAKFLKTQPQLAPAWFRALPTSASDSAAFVAFVAYGGGGASSGGLRATAPPEQAGGGASGAG